MQLLTRAQAASGSHEKLTARSPRRPPERDGREPPRYGDTDTV